MPQFLSNLFLLPPTVFPDQKGLIKAVNSAVEQITSKQVVRETIYVVPRDTKNIPESEHFKPDYLRSLISMTAKDPRLEYLDCILQEQFRLTPSLLSTQEAMHVTLKTSLQKRLTSP